MTTPSGSTASAGPAVAAPVSDATGTAAAPQRSVLTGQKICCACPETRKPRDECVVKYTEAGCADYIEAHKQCLRKHGFRV